MNQLLEAALKYEAKGMSVIPVAQDKKPLIKWESYQKQRATKEEIQAWWKKHPGANIGLVTGEISNLLVVDCDTPESTQRVQEAIPENLIVPCEKTPRGGMHFFFSHSEGFVNRARVAADIDIRTSGGYIAVAPSINGTGRSWEWVVSVLEFDPPEIAISIKALIKDSLYRESVTSKYEGISVESQEVTQGHAESPFFSEGRRDEDLFHAANCLIKGGAEQKFTSNVLNRLVNSWGENDPKWIDDKIKSALGRASKKERNISQELRDWIREVISGHFKVTDYHKESQIVTKQEKHALIMALKRLCDDKVLERTGKGTGEYRIIEREVEFMDFVNVSKEGAINLTLPLEIHRKTIFFPRNTIVIAGVTGYGKTSFLLNTIRDNGHKFKFKYFASEMSNLALNYKLARFNIPVEKWVNWMDVIPDDKWDHTNIQDKIFPDDMNVIDYLEPEGEKTYNIHDIITKIIKRLDKGMALIATQKKPGADLSAGGVYSAKASSLYLSLDWGTILIFKNRFREEDSNPMLSRRDFDIAAGQNFVPKGDWYSPQDKKKSKNYESFVKD